MDNLLESNERTLVMFDSVCVGLTECLALVHADIRQMTEHRNQLLNDQMEKLQTSAKLQAVGYHCSRSPTSGDDDDGLLKKPATPTRDNTTKSASRLATNRLDHNSDDLAKQGELEVDDEPGDPHHLARLKLLDKRLADSFNRALNMCDQQKTSLTAKRYNNNSAQHNTTRPSIFQVLLGKTSLGRNKSSSSNNNRINDKHAARGARDGDGDDDDDNHRVMIDDMNKQTRLAMQYSKQLEAHLYKVEDLRAKYEMHLKMGLIVKSVSRAYLTRSSANNNSSSPTIGRHQIVRSSPTPPPPPPPLSNSRQQMRQLYTSSLMVNDSSSNGSAMSRSSVSSLNLSNLSFSRSRRRERKDLQQQQTQQQQQQQKQSEQKQNSSSSKLEQKYVSTISLDGNSKQKRRLNLSKLISSAAPTNNSKQPIHHIEHHSATLSHRPHSRSHLISSPTARIVGQSAIDSTRPSSVNYNHNQQRLSQYTFGHEWPTPGVGSGGGVEFNQLDDSAYSTGCNQHYQPHQHQHDDYNNSDNNYDFTITQPKSNSFASLTKSASYTSLKRIKSKNQLAQSGLSHSRTTIKEFIENIDRIETEFESYMGSFLLTVEDIQGFARVCQGDVFDVNIKYGDLQKFKTKISVLKDNKQKCDNRQAVFKARIADVLAIKAYECKGALNKKLLLGHKLCETRDFFTARSQLMTISLNQTGSIKLNMIITWNPLHLAPNTSPLSVPGLDISHISLPPTPLSSSTISSLSSVPSINGTTTTINIQSRNRTPNKLSSPNLSQVVSTGATASIADQTESTSFYEIDPTYGYYIPEPDYMTTAAVDTMSPTTTYNPNY